MQWKHVPPWDWLSWTEHVNENHSIILHCLIFLAQQFFNGKMNLSNWHQWMHLYSSLRFIRTNVQCWSLRVMRARLATRNEPTNSRDAYVYLRGSETFDSCFTFYAWHTHTYSPLFVALLKRGKIEQTLIDLQTLIKPNNPHFTFDIRLLIEDFLSPLSL